MVATSAHCETRDEMGRHHAHLRLVGNVLEQAGARIRLESRLEQNERLFEVVAPAPATRNTPATMNTEDEVESTRRRS